MPRAKYLVRFRRKLYGEGPAPAEEPKRKTLRAVAEPIGLPSTPAVLKGPVAKMRHVSSENAHHKPAHPSTGLRGQAYKRLSEDRQKLRQRLSEQKNTRGKKKYQKVKPKQGREFSIKEVTNARVLEKYWTLKHRFKLLSVNTNFERYLLRTRKQLALPQEHYKAPRSAYTEYWANLLRVVYSYEAFRKKVVKRGSYNNRRLLKNLYDSRADIAILANRLRKYHIRQPGIVSKHRNFKTKFQPLAVRGRIRHRL